MSARFSGGHEQSGSLADSLSHGRCHCFSFKSAWAHAKGKTEAAPYTARLTAYIRVDGGVDKARQYKEIKDYCDAHRFEVVETYEDRGLPSLGMQAAFDSLERTDGIIATNLDIFVQHDDDPMRDLKPLLHRFFCIGDRHFITVEEGIDTATPEGQRAAVDYMSKTKEGIR